MLRKNKFWIILHAILLIVAGTMLVGAVMYAQYVSTHGYTYTMGDWSTKYEITLERAKEWEEGAHGYVHGMQYDGVIYNKTSENINSWVIEIQFVEGCNVDSYWNGTITYEDDLMTFICQEYNKVIEAHNSQPFGFVLHADTLDNIVSCKVIFPTPMKVTELTSFWIAIVLLGILLVVDITLTFVHHRNKELYERQRIAQQIIDQSFETFASIIDAKDPYTKGHSQRVAFYSREIAKRMDFDEEELDRIYMIGSVHDIGKVGIPDAILQKNGKLTPEEREVIKRHAYIGAEILKHFTAVPGIQEGAKYHHERYDGTGYGAGLAGDEIPLYARIIGVADAFDAMSSTRCYRAKLGLDTVVEELKRCSGTQFDPKVVDVLLELIEDEVVPVEVD